MRSTFLLSLILAVPAATLAQEVDSLRLYTVDPIVVTGTRIPKEKSRIPASVSAIARSEIESSGESNALPLTARRVPGIFLQERGTAGFGVAPGSGGSLSIRGISGAPNNRVLMLIDGQPQFMGLFGHPISDAYTTSDIERIEVVRGPASVLYGSSAMAGAINLVTRRTPGIGTRGSLQASGGSYGTYSVSASASQRRERIGVFAAGNYDRMDGVRSDREDGFRAVTGYAKVDALLSSSIRLSVDGNLVDARFHDPGPVSGDRPADYRRDYLRGRAAVAVENTHRRVEGAFMVFHNFGDHAFSGGFNSTDVNSGLTVYQNLKAGQGTVLTLGLDAKRFGGNAFVETPGGPVTLVDDERLTETDVYALLQQQLFGALDVNAGLRLVSNSEYGTEWVPAAGASYSLPTATTLRASVAKGFRSPHPVDLFIGPVANGDLEPERLWNLEAGIGQRLAGGRAGVEVTVFRANGDNMIQVVGGPGRDPRRENAGAFTNSGVELQLDASLHPAVQVHGAYTYLHLDMPVVLAPKNNLNLGAIVTRGPVTFSVNGHWVDDLLLSTAGAQPSESYFLLDMRADVAVRESLQLFARAENLLDQDYAIDLGYPMPGASVFAGIRIGR